MHFAAGQKTSHATILVTLLAAMVSFVAFAAVAQDDPKDEPAAVPDAPLVLARGTEVSVAWRFPVGHRPDGILIERKQGEGDYVQVGEVAVPGLSWVDRGLEIGLEYSYRIRIRRGEEVSLPSRGSVVSVGSVASLVFRGGSIESAVFDVVLVIEGRRFVESFVVAPGDMVGDLRFIESLGRAVDFRLGPRLRSLSLDFARGDEPVREEIKDATGGYMTDLSGRRIELEFSLPGDEREVLVAGLEMADRSLLRVNEGQSLALEEAAGR